MKFVLISLLFSLTTFSKPYHDPSKVVAPSLPSLKQNLELKTYQARNGLPVLRVEVDWNKSNESYRVSGSFLEKSGTPAFVKSAHKRDPFGSYKAILRYSTPTGLHILHASIGTGREFRQLVRRLSFRFPLFGEARDLRLVVEAEHPEKGTLQKVIDQSIDLTSVKPVEAQFVDVTLLRKALAEPSLKFNFYAEGFEARGKEKFLTAARKAIATLEKELPGQEHFEFRAVFAPSKLKIGNARDLGEVAIERDSFLGLYFPYWRKFGRWYHVVYPTNQTRYRNALAQVDYDYPLALVDDNQYWGVGNYKELTAVPVGNRQFTYLLLHEFGHFMGLNEEYEGGGPTELEFAPEVKEPWSQNITFNPDPVSIKWSRLLAPGIPVPTSRTDYHRHGGPRVNPVGAYKGGYADSLPRGKSHKPVMTCMMGTGGDFCPVCQDALASLIQQDLGE